MSDIIPSASSSVNGHNRAPNPWVGRGSLAASSSSSNSKGPNYSSKSREMFSACGIGSSEEDTPLKQPLRKLFENTATSSSDEQVFGNSPKRKKEDVVFSNPVSSSDDLNNEVQQPQQVGDEPLNENTSSPPRQSMSGIDDLSPIKDVLIKLFENTATESSDSDKDNKKIPLRKLFEDTASETSSVETCCHLLSEEDGTGNHQPAEPALSQSDPTSLPQSGSSSLPDQPGSAEASSSQPPSGDLNFASSGNEELESDSAQNRRKDLKTISRMDRTTVHSMDGKRLRMLGNDNLYIGDRRRKENKPKPTGIIAPKHSKRAELATSMQSIKLLMIIKCCKTHGTFGLHFDSADDLLEIRYHYHKELNAKQRQNFLTELYDERLRRGSWDLKGRALCWNGVCLSLGIASGTLFAAKSRALFGVIRKEDMPGQRRRAAHMTEGVVNWFSDFVFRYTEKMPHKSHLHLPACYSKVEIAQLCRQQCKFRIRPTSQFSQPSTRLFYEVWQTRFPHVTIPRLSEFNKCNFCAKSGQKLDNHKITPEQRAQVFQDQKGIIHISSWSVLPFQYV